MLILSLLIISALGVAVVSFFVAGTQWLLVVSAGLVVLAFYLSRRASRVVSGSDEAPAPAPPVREQVAVTIDELEPAGSGHRNGRANHDNEPDRDASAESQRQAQAGRAIAS